MQNLSKETILLFVLVISSSLVAYWQAKEIPPGVTCDSDSDCFLLRSGPLSAPVPALIYLSCTGGKPWDIDSVREVHDSLGWAIATCGKSRNHRSVALNEADIIRLVEKLKATGRVDKSKIVLFGFSGQGAQALGTALRHPDLFAGVISDCAHTGSVTIFDTDRSSKQAFYIITREQDWNRKYNEKLHNLFIENNIADTLIINPGEHGIGPAREIFDGCLWLAKQWNVNSR
ncbi:hypothetical protein DRQ36_06120 [bacterium]|nr:MAG: hypothetical protein DRQ36_06120 [bacterium]